MRICIRFSFGKIITCIYSSSIGAVLFALVAVEATFCSGKEDSICSGHKKSRPVSKSKVKCEVDVPYAKSTKGLANPSSPIAMETIPDTKSMEVDVPYVKGTKGPANLSSSIAMETTPDTKSMESSSVSRKQFTGSVSRKFKWDVPIPYGSATAPSTQASYSLKLFYEILQRFGECCAILFKYQQKGVDCFSFFFDSINYFHRFYF